MIIKKRDKRGNIIQMRSKKSFEMAISTLVVIALSVLILSVLIVAFSMGWERFWNTIKGYGGSEISGIESICKTQCNLNNQRDFCCSSQEIDFGQGKEKVNCLDKRLNISCGINCNGVC